MEQNWVHGEPDNVELFDKFISDLVLEVEEIKLKAARNDLDGINEHLTRMNSMFLEIMDAKLALAEKCKSIRN